MITVIFWILIHRRWMGTLMPSSNVEIAVPGENILDNSYGAVMKESNFQANHVQEALRADQKYGLDHSGNCQSDKHCPGNLKCLSNLCQCPPGFLIINNGSCVHENHIAFEGPLKSEYRFEWKCNPSVGVKLPGAKIAGTKPTFCSTHIITSEPIPEDIDPEDMAFQSFLAVDQQTGEIYFTGGTPVRDSPVVPCGYPELEIGGKDVITTPFNQTYLIQCMDSRGVTSSTNLIFHVLFPSCDIIELCDAQGL